MKRCTRCGEVKDESEFYPAQRGKPRLRNQCKACHRAALPDHSQDEKPHGRVCTRCKQHKPLSAFHKHKICLYGVEPICKQCRLEKRREYYSLHPDRARAADLKYQYGITLEEYEAMLARQAGKCAICGRADQKLVVDHNHVTGAVRSLLCHLCNAMIGCAREGPDILLQGAAYLRSYASDDAGMVGVALAAAGRV